MKKLICFILIIATLLSVPFAVSGADASTDGFVDLPEKTNAPVEIRTRKQVDGLRMYVDEENPLFMIRNCPVWGGPQKGEAFAEYAKKLTTLSPRTSGILRLFILTRVQRI